MTCRVRKNKFPVSVCLKVCLPSVQCQGLTFADHGFVAKAVLKGFRTSLLTFINQRQLTKNYGQKIITTLDLAYYARFRRLWSTNVATHSLPKNCKNFLGKCIVRPKRVVICVGNLFGLGCCGPSVVVSAQFCKRYAGFNLSIDTFFCPLGVPIVKVLSVRLTTLKGPS